MLRESYLARFIDVVRKIGYTAEVEFFITWMPVKCTDYKTFGHSLKVYSQKQQEGGS